MISAMQSGWYRRSDDAPHIVRKVSGYGGFFITCMFDTRVGAPCDGGGVLSPDAWRSLVPVPDPGFVPG